MADETYQPDENAEFTIKRVFRAPRERLWAAWTEPDFAARWWHPKGVSTRHETVKIDPRVGGTYAYTMVNDTTGDEYPTGGKYLELVEPERLVFTWGNPGDEGAPVITVDLTEVSEGTEMTFHLRGHAGKPGDGFIYDGWDEALEVLEEELESSRSGRIA